MKANDFENFMESFYDKAKEISKAKSQDYAKSEDVLSNIKAISSYGISPSVGLISRMQDKMSRLANFTKTGVFNVKDETVEDTLIDLANYCCLFAAYLHDENPQANDLFITDVA
jgi:hypothetical protein